MFLAYLPRRSRPVTWSLNLSVFENFPRQTPSEMSDARGTEMACRMSDSRT